ncbi:MAG: hypothetical protein J3K34DRAFT_413173 [Monoraphidium minutum]|nr:MAG: hypothetical protein J3K34DRAFT_413173 [Monoraphidium minutum]
MGCAPTQEAFRSHGWSPSNISSDGGLSPHHARRLTRTTEGPTTKLPILSCQRGALRPGCCPLFSSRGPCQPAPWSPSVMLPALDGLTHAAHWIPPWHGSKQVVHLLVKLHRKNSTTWSRWVPKQAPIWLAYVIAPAHLAAAALPTIPARVRGARAPFLACIDLINARPRASRYPLPIRACAPLFKVEATLGICARAPLWL